MMSTDIQHEESARDEDISLISKLLIDKNREAYEALSRIVEDQESYKKLDVHSKQELIDLFS